MVSRVPLGSAGFAGFSEGNDPLLVTLGNCWKFSEEDKRATTNVQNGLVFFFLFSFGLFSSL